MQAPADRSTLSLLLSRIDTAPMLAALSCAYGIGAFGAALAMQHLMGLEPCPLCIFQRVAILSASMAALLAAGWGAARPGRVSVALSALGAALALAGLAIACRHIYVMWFPQEVACGPDLEYLMEAFPPSKWLPKVFAGGAECSAAAKQLVLGLPIPVWAVLGFALQAAGLLRSAWRGMKPS